MSSFALGVIADVQYVDLPDGSNFSGKVRRRYRDSLKALHRAVDSWNAAAKAGVPLRGVLQLGDVIDGQNADRGPAAVTAALDATLGALARCDKSWCDGGVGVLHTIGNHELFCLKPTEALPRLMARSGTPVKKATVATAAAATAAKVGGKGGDGGVGAVRSSGGGGGSSEGGAVGHSSIGGGARRSSGPNGLYYSTVPGEGWRVLVLNAYDVSTLASKTGSADHALAMKYLSRNPNDVTKPGNWLAGMKGGDPRRRYNPNNGAVGTEQMKWIEAELAAAAAANERVVVVSHVPLFARATLTCTVLWNAEDVMERLHRSGRVVAVFAGHDHNGGFAVDKGGVHHVTFPSPMETPVPRECRADGILMFHPDRIELAGSGRVKSRTIPLDPSLFGVGAST